jgi:cephalosporin hydroxylase
MNNIKEIQSIWKDDEATHKLIAEELTALAHSIPEINAHRTFVEKESWGFGETCFCAMHKLLVDEMPHEFTFMEIGVYKGAILSLYRMLADSACKIVTRYGVTPLSIAGNFADSDYGKDIETIHDQFEIEKDYTILKGLSTDTEIIDQARMIWLDILYIDGGHDYKTVTSDLLNYTPLIKTGGFLVVDDCANDLDLPKNYFFGIESVTQAVNDFDLQSKGFEFILSVGHNKLYQKR